MGNHKEWRKMAKKFRRKRIRKKLALQREAVETEKREHLAKCSEYQAWLAEQTRLEEFLREEEKRLSREAHLKWEADEILAQQKWAKKQELAKQEAEMLEKQQALIKEEWEKEQELIQKEKENQEKEEQKKKEETEKIFKEIDLFIRGEVSELPPQINVPSETQPGKEICPFFQKVGACRFKDACSRNHIKPAISKTLLLHGFYSHFSLRSVLQAEYDTDIGLEYENSETYRHFTEFYEDIKEELQKYGELIQLKICSNEENHLRGNVYVEYSEERAAMSAFRALNGRYYAGKPINVEFVVIPSWKNAICGLQFRKHCPKGSLCNFLHVFRNPHKEFSSMEPRIKKTEEKDWRWSDSDSDDNSKRLTNRRKRHRSRSREKNCTKLDNGRRNSSRERHRSRESSYRERKYSHRRKKRDRD